MLRLWQRRPHLKFSLLAPCATIFGWIMMLSFVGEANPSDNSSQASQYPTVLSGKWTGYWSGQFVSFPHGHCLLINIQKSTYRDRSANMVPSSCLFRDSRTHEDFSFSAIVTLLLVRVYGDLLFQTYAERTLQVCDIGQLCVVGSFLYPI